jgi:tetratricopeptide (TPR) repeat protein
MRKIIVAAAALALCAAGLSAQDKFEIKAKDGKIILPDEISSDAAGNLSYTEGGKIKVVIKRKDYVWARTPKPEDVKAADTLRKKKDFAAAAAAYSDAAAKNKFLGWDFHCRGMAARSLYDAGKKDEALAMALEMLKQTPDDPEKDEKELTGAKKLAAEIYTGKKDYKSAAPLLDSLIKSNDDDAATFALNASGDTLHGKGEKKEANLMWLQTVLLFPSSPERPAALLKLANCLKELGDKRASIYADKLKNEYPGSPLVKDLK